MKEWKFDQQPNAAALTTINVLEKKYPILRVVHYLDDHSWGFFCGQTNDSKDGRIIGMQEVITLDPTLEEIADLPPGWGAWRESLTGKWQILNENKE